MRRRAPGATENPIVFTFCSDLFFDVGRVPLMDTDGELQEWLYAATLPL